MLAIKMQLSNINEKKQTSKIQEIKKGISTIVKAYREEKKNAHLEILTINEDLIFDGPIKDFQLSNLFKLRGSYKAGNLSNIFAEYFNRKKRDDYRN